MIMVSVDKSHRFEWLPEAKADMLRGIGLSEKAIPLERVLAEHGLDGALWALEAVKGYNSAIRLFACFCAQHVLPLFEKRFPRDPRPRKAIEAAVRFARGLATPEELAAAQHKVLEAIMATNRCQESVVLAAWAAYHAAECFTDHYMGRDADREAAHHAATDAICAAVCDTQEQDKKATENQTTKALYQEFAVFCRQEGIYAVQTADDAV
jgi:hypothetical protein